MPDAEAPAAQRRCIDSIDSRDVPGAAIALVALALLAHLIILATPGFFAHDEWQKLDHIRLHGFEHFARAYGQLGAGPSFGFPMRPLGFLQQGAVSSLMEPAPMLAHLVGVLAHALVALLFVWILVRSGVAWATAGIAGVLFAVSPLTTIATGWLAASFDQLYVLFLLLAALLIVKLPKEGMSILRAAGVVASTMAALLSKETAIAAPLAVLILGYVIRIDHPERCSWPRIGAVFAIVLIPVLAYLMLRASAISASLAGNTEPAYLPDPRNAPGNFWRFFSFPFRLKLVKVSANVFRSPWQPLAAAIVHLALVAAVAALFGWRYAVAYLAAYFAFLLPPITLPNPGMHMLYASGLVMSFAIAAVLQRLRATSRKQAVVFTLAAVVGVCLHNANIQRHLYEHGLCQSRFLTSLDTILAQQAPETRGVVVVPMGGELLGAPIRGVAAREPYARDGVSIVTFASPDQSAGADAVRLRMTAECVLRPEAATPQK